MTSERFNELLEERFDKIRASLTAKSAEYASGDNKLHNFDAAARKRNTSREDALDGMRIKHIISVDDIRKKADQGILPTIAQIDEKIGDIINYYFLEEACYVDRIDKALLLRQHLKGRDL